MRQGFIKVAALTPKVTVADTKTNREEICRLMDEAEQKGAKILEIGRASCRERG